MRLGCSSNFINAFLDFTPTCFGKSLQSTGSRGFLSSYSGGLYCGCTWITVRSEWSVVEGCNQASMFSFDLTLSLPN
jgi:hypothetical protein